MKCGFNALLTVVDYTMSWRKTEDGRPRTVEMNIESRILFIDLASFPSTTFREALCSGRKSRSLVEKGASY